MTSNFDELLKKEAFNGLTMEQKLAYKDLATTLNGKNAVEAMPIIMNFMKAMPKGYSLSDEEQNAMFQATLQSLSPADASKFKNIMKMMEMMKSTASRLDG